MYFGHISSIFSNLFPVDYIFGQNNSGFSNNKDLVYALFIGGLK